MNSTCVSNFLSFTFFYILKTLLTLFFFFCVGPSCFSYTRTLFWNGGIENGIVTSVFRQNVCVCVLCVFCIIVKINATLDFYRLPAPSNKEGVSSLLTSSHSACRNSIAENIVKTKMPLIVDEETLRDCILYTKCIRSYTFNTHTHSLWFQLCFDLRKIHFRNSSFQYYSHSRIQTVAKQRDLTKNKGNLRTKNQTNDTPFDIRLWRRKMAREAHAAHLK